MTAVSASRPFKSRVLPTVRLASGRPINLERSRSCNAASAGERSAQSAQLFSILNAPRKIAGRCGRTPCSFPNSTRTSATAPYVGASTSFTAAASTSDAGWRSRPAFKVATRPTRLLAPVFVMTLLAKAATCWRIMGEERSRPSPNVTRSRMSTFSTVTAPWIWLANCRCPVGFLESAMIKTFSSAATAIAPARNRL